MRLYSESMAPGMNITILLLAALSEHNAELKRSYKSIASSIFSDEFGAGKKVGGVDSHDLQKQPRQHPWSRPAAPRVRRPSERARAGPQQPYLIS